MEETLRLLERRRPVRGRWATVAAVAMLLAAGAGRAAGQEAAAPGPAGLELTPQVRESLSHLEEGWLQWMSAVFQKHPDKAAGVLDDLLMTSAQLGFSRLPDLSLGAAARAVQAAREGDPNAAALALQAAERLDPGRASTAFAHAAVARLEGRYPTAVVDEARGFRLLFGHGVRQDLWWADAAVWALAVLLMTGALWIALQLGVKGGALYADLQRWLARKLPSPMAHVAAWVILLWPLALPAPLALLLLYLSVLLWGYGSVRERVVLVALWLLVGFAPPLLDRLSSEVQVGLSPEVRGMANLEAGRLDGMLFRDLESLEARLPDDPAVWQLMGDLERRLGQWELAHGFYEAVVEAEPENVGALLDLGAYFFHKGDFGSAVRYFEQVTQLDSGNVAAYLNLSQAYSQSYLFDDARRALNKAQLLDDLAVSRFMSQGGEERTLDADGGLTRVREIQEHLAAAELASRGAQGAASGLRLPWGRGWSPLVSLGVLLGAVALYLVRRGGYSVPPSLGDGGWWRALVPGVTSADDGAGFASFAALLLPTTFLALPVAGYLSFPLPWGYDPGGFLATLAAVLGLAVYFGIRLWRQVREGS